MAAFYPTPWLKKHAPWLPGQVAGSPQGDGGGAPPDQNGQNGPQGAGQASDRVGLPDPAISERGSISVAGRTLPLPAGDWHPILTAQSGPHGEISQQVLARTDRGVVSGVIMVRASQQPLPQDVADDLETPCHDDRDYASTITGKPGVFEECVYMGNVVLSHDSVSPDPFISAAFDRMRTLGFPIPPLMLNVGWYHAAASGSVAGAKGVQIETVETLVAPIERGSRQLLAPLPAWTKTGYRDDPNAARFITALGRWMPKWADTLRRGFNGTLDPSALSAAAVSDPSAPS